MLPNIFTAFFDEFANNQLFGIIVILVSGLSCALLLSGVQAAWKPKTKAALGERTGCTVLVIDDSPMLLRTVKSVLTKRGFNMLTSSCRAVCGCCALQGFVQGFVSDEL